MFGGFKSKARSAVFATSALLALAVVAMNGSAMAGTTYSSIQKSGKWASCSVCAGKNGSGPVAYYSQTLYISSPSISGASSKYAITSMTAPYAAALWWKQLGANSGVTHFVYDMNFYLKNPSAPQALEFDVNQSVGGHKYIFGTECDIKGTHTWRVWSASSAWNSTGIYCSAPSAYKWHHLTEEFQRINGKVQFVSITLDGVKHYVNRTYYPKSSSVSELNVAFQMDGNGSKTPYQVWLDNVKLTVW